jgi:hypothetical protein
MLRVQLAALRIALRPRGAAWQALLDSSGAATLQYRLLSWTRRALGRTGAAEFDADLRPLLIADGVSELTLASDPPAWCTNQFFMVWLRREFLSSRYARASAAAAAALSARIDDHPLLTRAEASTLFDFPSRGGGAGGTVSSGADDERARNDIVARRTAAERTAAPLAGEIAESAAPAMPMVDLLDVAGACVGGRGSFNLFCEERQIFEYLTREYVDALAERIAARARDLVERGVVAQRPVKVLEVGAGSGRLAEAVAAALHARAPLLCDVIATDTGDWRLFGGARAGAVRASADPRFKLSAEGADRAEGAVDGAALVRYSRGTSSVVVKQHNPAIVLCAWMPPGVDWTAAWRKCDAVQEYVLIGETPGNDDAAKGAVDDGCCGSPFLTWGRGATKAAPAPYASDGWDQAPLDEASALQLARFDAPYADEWRPFGRRHFSKSVAFTRRQRVR